MIKRREGVITHYNNNNRLLKYLVLVVLLSSEGVAAPKEITRLVNPLLADSLISQIPPYNPRGFIETRVADILYNSSALTWFFHLIK